MTAQRIVVTVTMDAPTDDTWERLFAAGGGDAVAARVERYIVGRLRGRVGYGFDTWPRTGNGSEVTPALLTVYGVQVTVEVTQS